MIERDQQVTVCICTYRRPELLRRCLEAVAQQETDDAFNYSITVSDNDSMESARQVVSEFSSGASVPVRYCVEHRRNIALARNKALDHADGDFIAFIDDDEYPAPRWLVALVETCIERRASGVLGPVRPHFELPPPAWIIRGGFFERPEHPTGFVMHWSECRTGNVLLKRALVAGLAEPFRPEFGTDGEDTDFFRRMAALGHTFVWCNDAVAYETVPPNRWKRSFLLKRGLLRGTTAGKGLHGSWSGVLKSVLALPLYVTLLPVLLVAGHHYFMKYLVKICDHGGKLLALVGVAAIREREM